jgi:hypothetical protein
MRIVHASFLYAVLTIVIGVLGAASIAEASFGITPPYVRNTSLTRNSIYEQQILLVRGTPDTEQIAEVSIDAPGIEDWLTIEQGDEIALPRGEQKVPMTVRVQVPADAEFKQYSGRIRIRTLPADGELRRGAVNISLGAVVQLDLTVIDKEIRDFRVRRIDFPDLNAGHKIGWLYFPGRIQFGMVIENTGNVNVAPSQVAMEIYDRQGNVLLEETEHIGRIRTVEPFATKEVSANLPTRLPAGDYLSRYQIYNGEEVVQQGEIAFSIREHGTLQAAGFGFAGLSMPHKISLVLPVLTLLTIIGYLLFARYRRRARERSNA